MASGSGWNLWVWLVGGGCGWNLWMWLVQSWSKLLGNGQANFNKLTLTSINHRGYLRP